MTNLKLQPVEDEGHLKQMGQRIRFKFLKDPSGKIMGHRLEGDESGSRKTNFTSWQKSCEKGGCLN